MDFHVHSEFSPDSVTKIEDIVSRAKSLNLGKLIITDHNTTKGAMILKKRYPEFVIVGEEIMTTRGEVLAFFLQKEIPRGLTPLETVKRLKDQCAFISLSHPYSYSRAGWYEDEMLELLPYLDAIEIANGRNTRAANEKAANFAKLHGLAGTAGSDAHGLMELGRITLTLDSFDTADELRAALKSAQVIGEPSSQWVKLTSRTAAVRKRLGFYKESDGIVDP